MVRKFKRNQVVILKKGRKWNWDVSMEEWLEGEIDGSVDIEYMREERKDIPKVWCESETVMEEIWSKKREWERMKVVRAEEWKTIKERKARYEALEEIRRLARATGYEAKIELNEKEGGRVIRMETQEGGQG